MSYSSSSKKTKASIQTLVADSLSEHLVAVLAVNHTDCFIDVVDFWTEPTQHSLAIFGCQYALAVSGSALLSGYFPQYYCHYFMITKSLL